MNRPHPGAQTRGINGASQFLEGMAGALRNAHKDAPIPSIAPSIPYPNIGVAYGIQETNVRHWIDGGRALVGRKIAFPEASVKMYGAKGEAIVGMVFENALFKSGANLSLAPFLQPRASPAVAFRLSRDILADPDDAPHCIDHAYPALEILDSRIQGWAMSDIDLAADNASIGAIVLGDASSWKNDSNMVTAEISSAPNASQTSHDFALPNMPSTIIYLAQKMIARGRPLLAGDLLVVGALNGVALTIESCNLQARFSGLGIVEVQLT